MWKRLLLRALRVPDELPLAKQISSVKDGSCRPCSAARAVLAERVQGVIRRRGRDWKLLFQPSAVGIVLMYVGATWPRETAAVVATG
jgi:hypothetical protein